MILDLFAGPGGWSEGLRLLGLNDVGIEYEPWACRTRRNAGHATILADVAAYPTGPFAGKVTGLIASPPCPAFSNAGKGEGREHIPELVAAIHRRDWAFRPDPDPRIWLSLDIGRWISELRPEWVALEQVPAVLPLWHAYAHVLKADGYSVWVGKLNAADHGVPQIRHRAILMASRVRAVTPPVPSHGENPEASLFDPLARWVTMAEALGWGMAGKVGFPRLDDTGGPAGGYRERDWRSVDEPAFAVTEKARSWVVSTGMDWDASDGSCQVFDPAVEPARTVTVATGGQWWLVPGIVDGRNRRRRRLDEPAPVVAFGHDAASWKFTNEDASPDEGYPPDSPPDDPEPWVVSTGMNTMKHSRDVADMVPYERSIDEPAPTLGTMSGGQWTVGPAGHRTPPMSWKDRGDDGALWDADVEPAVEPGARRPSTQYADNPEQVRPGKRDGWEQDRPATTIAGDPRVFAPGSHTANDGRNLDNAVGRSAEAIKITVRDALLLQSFPPDYPVAGTKTRQFEQIGNAVPPLLARAVLAQLATP